MQATNDPTPETTVGQVTIPKGQRLLVSLPTVMAMLFGVSGIAIGQRHVWVSCGGVTRRINRSILNDVRFHDIALPARRAAFPEL